MAIIDVKKSHYIQNSITLFERRTAWTRAAALCAIYLKDGGVDLSIVQASLEVLSGG